MTSSAMPMSLRTCSIACSRVAKQSCASIQWNSLLLMNGFVALVSWRQTWQRWYILSGKSRVPCIQSAYMVYIAVSLVGLIA